MLAYYELTATTGLECLAAEEVEEKLKIKPIVEKGRIRMSYDGQVQDLLELRTINNIFVTIFSRKNLADEEMPTADTLQEFLYKINDDCDWNIGLTKWLETSKFPETLQILYKKDSNLRDRQPKFRVSCNRFGNKHEFQSPDVCCKFGNVMDNKFGWPIKMKGFDLEALLNIYENDINVSITLTPTALDKRNIDQMGYTTLRGTTCYAMLRLANIQLGDIVVDPMAGSGAIPIECSMIKEWLAYAIAADLRKTQVNKCQHNVRKLNLQSTDILCLDVKYLPFKDCCIDVFVSDLPFGKRLGNKGLNLALYTALLGEMARCSRNDSGRAILLTHDKTAMNYGMSKNSNYWTNVREQFVKVGNLPCFIFVLKRTSIKYTPFIM